MGTDVDGPKIKHTCVSLNCYSIRTKKAGVVFPVFRCYTRRMLVTVAVVQRVSRHDDDVDRDDSPACDFSKRLLRGRTSSGNAVVCTALSRGVVFFF